MTQRNHDQIPDPREIQRRSTDIIEHFVSSLARDLRHGTQEIRFDLETARARMKKALIGVRDAIDKIITDLQNADDFSTKITIIEQKLFGPIIGVLGKYGQQMLLDIGYLIAGISPKQMKTVIRKIFKSIFVYSTTQERLEDLVRKYKYMNRVSDPARVIFSLHLVRYTESNDNYITTMEQVLKNIEYIRSDISRGQTPNLITLFKQIISAYEVINHFISFQPENNIEDVEDEKERIEFQIIHHMLIRACRRKIGEFWDAVYSLVKFLIFDPAPQENTNLQRRISQENDAIVAQFKGLTIKIMPKYPPVVEITFDGYTPITLTDPLKKLKALTP